MTTASQEDYLRDIYLLQTDQLQADAAVTTNLLAERLSVSAPSVTAMVKKLAEDGLLRHTPYYGVGLTERGQQLALRIVRRHRLIESFLVQILHYGWDEVHEEAHRLEHAASDLFVERIADMLGRPTVDPHGQPIPTLDGWVPKTSGESLLAMDVGSAGQVIQILDEEPSFLRHVGERGLRPGAAVRLIERAPFDGPLTIAVGDRREVVGRAVASRIRVQASPPTISDDQ
jgi:DtxR family Mn-dependent transcriptional regulator